VFESLWTASIRHKDGGGDVPGLDKCKASHQGIAAERLVAFLNHSVNDHETRPWQSGVWLKRKRRGHDVTPKMVSLCPAKYGLTRRHASVISFAMNESMPGPQIHDEHQWMLQMGE